MSWEEPKGDALLEHWRRNFHDPRRPGRLAQGTNYRWLAIKKELGLPKEMTLREWLRKIAPAPERDQ